MRTKTILLAAVLSAAGIASSLAQAVYSVNVVGYVNYPAKAPFSMIANPLDNKAGNNLNNILPSVPIGTTIYTWNGTTFASSVFFGSWAPDITLAPGEGAFINLAADTTLTWVGEVMQGALANAIPAGLSIKSSQVPQALKLENSPTDPTDPGLGFPAAIGDTIYFFRGTPPAYVSSVYFGSFSPPAIPAVGEAFWVSTSTAKSWTRTFSVSP
jgi:hypothetical protein